MHRRHDPTYYWATRRLPEEIRPATHALYGYVRTADEIVDGPRRPADPQARRAALDAWEAELEAGLATGHSRQPVIGALVDAGRRHRLPLGELTAYMGSMRVDCAPVRMETWDELVTYMEGSAGSVGRIMAPLLGVPAAHHAGFGRLGLAFQHANFIRDVREDRRARPDLPAGRGPPPLRRRRRRLRRPAATRRAACARRARGPACARRCSPSAEAAVEAAPASVRPGIRLACAIYLGVLDRVEAIGYDVLGRRPRLPRLAAAARRAGGAEAMTRRATLRGEERTPLAERADVLVCGASFAGLAVARELAGSGADVLVVDRYEIGERQTSRLRGPDAVARARWASARAVRQELQCMCFHTPHGAARHRLPWSWSSFDYRTLCQELWEQCDARFEIAKVERAHGAAVHTDRGDADRAADRRRARLAPRARPRR